MTLEDKLKRLQEIQQMLEQKKISLSDSLPLLEEAFELKKGIEEELKQMENRLIKLNTEEENEVDLQD